MATVSRFEDLQAWQTARALARKVYEVCRQDKVSRDFGFCGQFCRAAVSVMNNVAEGFARKNDKEFARFLDFARGSLTEVQSMLYLAKDIGYVSDKQFDELFGQSKQALGLIAGMMTYLRKTLRNAGSDKD